MPSKYHKWTKAQRKREPEPYVSIIAHQPDDRPYVPAGMGFTARNFVLTPPKPQYTARPRTGLSYADKMAAASARWDADHGAGITPRTKVAGQPAGYTARKGNPDAKAVRGISDEARNALVNGRAWVR